MQLKEKIDPFPTVREHQIKIQAPSLNSQRHLQNMPLVTVSEEAELMGTMGHGDHDSPTGMP